MPHREALRRRRARQCIQWHARIGWSAQAMQLRYLSMHGAGEPRHDRRRRALARHGARGARRRMTASPRYPLEGVASWNMNTTCNYRCSYCTQRFVDDRGQWARDLPRFIAAFAALPGDWEIKLSGGEPFRHPDFLDAVAKLAAARLRVSVVTNFSAPLDELFGFVDATATRPGLISASLHLEYAEPDAFLAKVRAVQERHAGRVV